MSFLKKPQGPGADDMRPLTQDEIYDKSVATLRDYLAPAGLEVRSDMLKLAGRFARTIFIYNYPRYLTPGWFSPIVNLDEAMDLSIFFHPLDTALVMRNLRKKAAQFEAQINASN